MKNAEKNLAKLNEFWSQEWGGTNAWKNVKVTEKGYLMYKNSVVAVYDLEAGIAMPVDWNEAIPNNPRDRKFMKYDYEVSASLMEKGDLDGAY